MYPFLLKYLFQQKYAFDCIVLVDIYFNMAMKTNVFWSHTFEVFKLIDFYFGLSTN
jgi:hypothetical protein